MALWIFPSSDGGGAFFSGAVVDFTVCSVSKALPPFDKPIDFRLVVDHLL